MMATNTDDIETEQLKRQVRFLRECNSMQPTQRAKHMPWMAKGEWFTGGLLVGGLLMWLAFVLPGGVW